MNKPKLTRKELERMISTHKIEDRVFVVGIRGYYKRTMGNPLKNDRGIYDDALFIVTPDSFQPFNANTDPSKFGKNKSGNGIATLVPGMYRYRPGPHGINSGKPYPAFIQADKVKVTRDGNGDRIFEGYFGINIHRGGSITTSSEGCQTIYKTQWEKFHSQLTLELDKWHQETFTYLLIDPEN